MRSNPTQTKPNTGTLLTAIYYLTLATATTPSALSPQHHISPTTTWGRIPTPTTEIPPPSFTTLRSTQARTRPTWETPWTVRGGGDDDGDGVAEEEMSLEDKVAAAMARLGLTPDGLDDAGEDDDRIRAEPEVVAEEPEVVTEESAPASLPQAEMATNEVSTEEKKEESIETTIRRISNDMDVDETIVVAALGATREGVGVANGGDGILNETAARAIIQNEIDAVASVPEDCDELITLTDEGHDSKLARRALAFADRSLPTARAILYADEEDAREEAEEKAAAEAEAAAQLAAVRRRADTEARHAAEHQMERVEVAPGFDPTNPLIKTLPDPPTPPTPPEPKPAPAAPPRAETSTVVFSATSDTIESLVLESPVPVLLDVYADWCGPCKALTPALAEMAERGGGLFRLVKLDTDAERTLSTALGVEALPTVFAVRDGRVINSFKGMPPSEEFIKSFMIGLMTGEVDNMEEEERERYVEITKRFVKVATSAGLSFAARERLVQRTNDRLDALVPLQNMAAAGRSAKILSSLLSNIIRDPFDVRFRRVNLDNRLIAQRVAPFPPAVAILKSVGFGRGEGTPRGTLLLAAGKKVVNVAPVAVVKETIDRWRNKNAREIASAERREKDRVARERLLAEAEEVESDAEEEEEEVSTIDPNVCRLKLRVEGKNKVHAVTLHADDPLSSVLTAVPSLSVPQDVEVRITCTARRLTVLSSTPEMSMSLREHGLTPAASIVVQIGGGIKGGAGEGGRSSLQERAAARKSKKKGEHTMQSVGIYSKDDNLKGELIDGGGGTWYEQDVTSDEGEEEVKEDDGAEEEIVSGEDASGIESGEDEVL